MRIEDRESAHDFKKYMAEAMARYQVEHGLKVDDFKNWMTACRYYNDYFDLATFKV